MFLVTARISHLRGHLRTARSQAPSERACLARSASNRTPDGCDRDFPPPIRSPPLPLRLAHAIAERGVVVAAAELLAGVEAGGGGASASGGGE
jgi:hypothetical protein